MEIFTFNARNNILWDCIQDSFKLDEQIMYQEIVYYFDIVCKQLQKNGIQYNELKNILVPAHDKLDICFIFDSTKTLNEVCYGNEVLNSMLPEILKIEKVAVFCGDIIGGDSKEAQQNIKISLQRHLPHVNFDNYGLSNQYYVIYLNNINEITKNNIDISMKHTPSYVGYIDMTFSSFLKDVISFSVVQNFFKFKNKICISTPMYEYTDPKLYFSFDFSKYNINIIQIEDVYYDSFLTYKIERSYYDFDNRDQKFSFNAVIQTPDIISDYKIIIEDAKLGYLKEKKLGSLKVVGIDLLTKEDLIKTLQAKINTNYVFNMQFSSNFNCLKFATLIEISNGLKKKKYLVVFEVKREEKELRLITMY